MDLELCFCLLVNICICFIFTFIIFVWLSFKQLVRPIRLTLKRAFIGIFYISDGTQVKIAEMPKFRLSLLATSNMASLIQVSS